MDLIKKMSEVNRQVENTGKVPEKRGPWEGTDKIWCYWEGKRFRYNTRI